MVNGNNYVHEYGQSLMNLNDLLVYAAVVDADGFAEAARRLRMPRSTVSKRIAELERQIGATLLQRTTRSLAVTDIGRELHRYAKSIQSLSDEAATLLRERRAEPSGVVRLTASYPAAQHAIAEILPGLATRFPKVRIEFEATDRFVDIVHEGFDIAVRDHFGALPNSGLTARTVLEEPMLLIASPAWRAAFGAIETPDDLRERGAQALHEGSLRKLWRLQRGEEAPQDLQLETRLVANETSVLLSAAQAGLGVARIPASLARDRLAAGTLEHILPEWRAGEVRTTLLFPPGRLRLPSVRAIADALALRLRAPER